MFFVKLSDLLYTIPNVPHLRNIKLAVEYREIYETEEHARRLKLPQKWKQDPGIERYHGFAPRHNYYVNGKLVGEELPTLTQTSKTPFSEHQVPRRGLIPVPPDDPDYRRLCLAQGLHHLVKNQRSSRSSSPSFSASNSATGATDSPLLTEKGVDAPHRANGHAAVVNGGHVNGIHDGHGS